MNSPLSSYRRSPSGPCLLRRQVENRANPHGAVFPTRRGTWRQISNWERMWNQVVDDTAYDWVTFHTFRRSAATLIDREVGIDAALQLNPTVHAFPGSRSMRSAQAQSAHEWLARGVPALLLDSYATRFKSQRASAWTFAQVRGPLPAPPVGLEPTTLRLTAECSAS